MSVTWDLRRAALGARHTIHADVVRLVGESIVRRLRPTIVETGKITFIAAVKARIDVYASRCHLTRRILHGALTALGLSCTHLALGTGQRCAAAVNHGS